MGNTPKYRVRNWETYFEVSQIRSVKKWSWVPMPTNHGGRHYRRIIGMDNSAELFSAFCLTVEVAANCKPRGTLQDDEGHPYTPEDMCFKTGAPAAWFERSWTVLASPDIAWLEVAGVVVEPGGPDPQPISPSRTALSPEPPVAGVDSVVVGGDLFSPPQPTAAEGCPMAPAGNAEEARQIGGVAGNSKPKPKPKPDTPSLFNHVGCWIDLRKAAGLQTVVTGQETRASKMLFADLGKDPVRFKTVLSAYLNDRDQFLANAGWPISLVHRQLQRYAGSMVPVAPPQQLTPEEQWAQVAAHWVKVGHEVRPEQWSQIELDGIRAAVKRLHE